MQIKIFRRFRPIPCMSSYKVSHKGSLRISIGIWHLGRLRRLQSGRECFSDHYLSFISLARHSGVLAPCTERTRARNSLEIRPKSSDFTKLVHFGKSWSTIRAPTVMTFVWYDAELAAVETKNMRKQHILVWYLFYFYFDVLRLCALTVFYVLKVEVRNE